MKGLDKGAFKIRCFEWARGKRKNEDLKIVVTSEVHV